MNKTRVDIRQVFSQEVEEAVRSMHLAKTTTSTRVLDVRNLVRHYFGTSISRFASSDSVDKCQQSYEIDLASVRVIVHIQTDSQTSMTKRTIRQPSTILGYQRMATNMYDELGGGVAFEGSAINRLLNFVAACFSSLSETTVYLCESSGNFWEMLMVDSKANTSVSVTIGSTSSGRIQFS